MEMDLVGAECVLEEGCVWDEECVWEVLCAGRRWGCVVGTSAYDRSAGAKLCDVLSQYPGSSPIVRCF